MFIPVRALSNRRQISQIDIKMQNTYFLKNKSSNKRVPDPA